MHKRVVEASGESIDGCVVCVDVHIESMFVAGGCAMQLLLSMAGIVNFVCRNCKQRWFCVYMLGVLSYVVKFYCCMLNVADMNCLSCGRLWSEQC